MFAVRASRRWRHLGEDVRRGGQTETGSAGLDEGLGLGRVLGLGLWLAGWAIRHHCPDGVGRRLTAAAARLA
ncbi:MULTISPECIES: hypothetical protein [unclassified Parafrankia]|uniref:hypothetical protein n=1 Tax=unclassified Parafrankia TaxID=2994368 RepID=UPI000DA48C51|nr:MULTISPECIES: hypothetical protein [unclassified Parafrankia]SQD96472.1 hypothetical protein FMEAI12_3640096 [Parafrankia sp. Ea1.12]